jgi:hypothetical protein
MSQPEPTWEQNPNGSLETRTPEGVITLSPSPSGGPRAVNGMEWQYRYQNTQGSGDGAAGADLEIAKKEALRAFRWRLPPGKERP